jgi:peptidoglycan/LPS O-acetylase OafA/YrhL
VFGVGRSEGRDPTGSVPKANRTLGHEPVLDGLRGAAWLTVFVSHAGLISDVAAGQVAMFVFFGLSGFLISSLLVAEYSRTGRISLPNFYARRALRLLPALVLFLFLWLCVVALFGHEPWMTTVPGGGKGSGEPFTVALQGVGAALVYVTNWFSIFKVINGYVPLGHLWSLAVEEQFYLVWGPLLLVLLSRLGSRAAVAVTSGLACLTFLDLIFIQHASSTTMWVYMGTDVRAGAFLIGGALAILRPRLSLRSLWVRLTRPAIVISMGIAVFAGWVFDHPVSPLTYDAGWIAVSIAAPVLVLALVDRPKQQHRSFLERPVLTYLGRRSYALYLWHYVWLTWLRSLGLLGVIGAFAATVISAELSWRLVESRALSYKGRFVSRSPAPESKPDRHEEEIELAPTLPAPVG